MPSHYLDMDTLESESQSQQSDDGGDDYPEMQQASSSTRTANVRNGNQALKQAREVPSGVIQVDRTAHFASTQLVLMTMQGIRDSVTKMETEVESLKDIRRRLSVLETQRDGSDTLQNQAVQDETDNDHDDDDDYEGPDGNDDEIHANNEDEDEAGEEESLFIDPITSSLSRPTAPVPQSEQGRKRSAQSSYAPRARKLRRINSHLSGGSLSPPDVRTAANEQIRGLENRRDQAEQTLSEIRNLFSPSDYPIVDLVKKVVKDLDDLRHERVAILKQRDDAISRVQVLERQIDSVSNIIRQVEFENRAVANEEQGVIGGSIQQDDMSDPETIQEGRENLMNRPVSPGQDAIPVQEMNVASHPRNVTPGARPQVSSLQTNETLNPDAIGMPETRHPTGVSIIYPQNLHLSQQLMEAVEEFMKITESRPLPTMRHDSKAMCLQSWKVKQNSNSYFPKKDMNACACCVVRQRVCIRLDNDMSIRVMALPSELQEKRGQDDDYKLLVTSARAAEFRQAIMSSSFLDYRRYGKDKHPGLNLPT